MNLDINSEVLMEPELEPELQPEINRSKIWNQYKDVAQM